MPYRDLPVSGRRSQRITSAPSSAAVGTGIEYPMRPLYNHTGILQSIDAVKVRAKRLHDVITFRSMGIWDSGLQGLTSLLRPWRTILPLLTITISTASVVSVQMLLVLGYAVPTNTRA